MIFKIKTSNKTEQIFKEIGGAEYLQPFILVKLAIALSLKEESKLKEEDFKTDNNGLELNIQTITGEYNETYKCLIEDYEDKHLTDEEYSQEYLKAHIDRGAKFLYSEFRYEKDFILGLLKEEKGI